MRFIPKTTFFFGLELGSDDVEPGHETQAGPFYIDEIVVTVEQYRMCLESQRCQAPSENSASTGTPPTGSVELRASFSECGGMAARGAGNRSPNLPVGEGRAELTALLPLKAERQERRDM